MKSNPPKVEPPKDELRTLISNEMVNVALRIKDRPTNLHPVKDGRKVIQLHHEGLDKIIALIKLQQEALLLGVVEILDYYNVPMHMTRQEKMSPDDLTRVTSVIANHDDLVDNHNMKKALRDYTINKLRLEL